jgi:hypothetical protein
VIGLLPVHAPAWQLSLCVQALPSEQAVPLATTKFVQPMAGSQESAVQGLPSLQRGAEPAVHVPA